MDKNFNLHELTRIKLNIDFLFSQMTKVVFDLSKSELNGKFVVNDYDDRDIEYKLVSWDGENFLFTDYIGHEVEKTINEIPIEMVIDVVMVIMEYENKHPGVKILMDKYMDDKNDDKIIRIN